MNSIKRPVLPLIVITLTASLASADDETREPVNFDLAHTIQTKNEADVKVIEISGKLQLEANRAFLTTSEGSTTTTEGSTTPAEDSDEPDIIVRMKDLKKEVKAMKKKLKSLAGEVRKGELKDWNANHEQLKAQLFAVLQSQADNGEISDDLAPILEEIRLQFLEITDAVSAAE